MSESYVNLFLNSAIGKGDFTMALTLFFLFLARMLPIIALSPFFGSRVMPIPGKIALAISLFIVFLPMLLQVTEHPINFSPIAVILMVKEIFIGILLGFMISLPFNIVQNAGIMIDHQRGGASLMVNDPTIQNQSSPLGTLFNMVLIVLFFYISGPFLFLDAIAKSYEIIPPDRFFSSTFFVSGTPFWKMVIQLFNKVMVLSVQLATPALLIILMTQVFLGIANRLAPQVQITFLGMPLNSLLALLVICVGWSFFNSEVIKQVYMWLEQIKEIILLMGQK